MSAVTIVFGDAAATDAAFAKAKHVAKVRLVNNRVTANPIRAALRARRLRCRRRQIYALHAVAGSA